MGEPHTSGRERTQRFDGLALAARRGTISGTVDAYTLERVEDRLGDENGIVPPTDVNYAIEGDIDASGHAVLNLAISGTVPLECQRCLRLFDWPVRHRTSLLLARDEQELAYLDEHDEREVLLADAPLDRIAIIEDELLLSLPYVPRCEQPDCVAVHEEGHDSGNTTPSAFERLKSLKGSTGPREN